MRSSPSAYVGGGSARLASRLSSGARFRGTLRFFTSGVAYRRDRSHAVADLLAIARRAECCFDLHYGYGDGQCAFHPDLIQIFAADI